MGAVGARAMRTMVGSGAPRISRLKLLPLAMPTGRCGGARRLGVCRAYRDLPSGNPEGFLRPALQAKAGVGRGSNLPDPVLLLSMEDFRGPVSRNTAYPRTGFWDSASTQRKSARRPLAAAVSGERGGPPVPAPCRCMANDRLPGIRRRHLTVIKAARWIGCHHSSDPCAGCPSVRTVFGPEPAEVRPTHELPADPPRQCGRRRSGVGAVIHANLPLPGRHDHA